MSKIKKTIWLIFSCALIAGLVFIFTSPNSFSIKNNLSALWQNSGSENTAIMAEKTNSIASSTGEVIGENEGAAIRGSDCGENSRYFAVMMSGDNIARPLSGISEAKIVVEMPVVINNINRFMALFNCMSGKEIGSIRSARQDFITLAQGFDAIFAHWGGSHFAQDILKKRVIDNIDALSDPYLVYFRKKGIAMPHNGFSSLGNLEYAAKKFGYRLENKFSGYETKEDKSDATSAATLSIGYPGSFQVKYEYQPAANQYLRWRGGQKEVDRNSQKQVAAKNVIIMRAAMRSLEDQYNIVDVAGEGLATIYQNGLVIVGSWQKDKNNPQSKLIFFDKGGQEIKMVPGSIWIQVVDPTTQIQYK